MIRTLLDQLALLWAWIRATERPAHTPTRGASRDRSRPGKDRIRERRQHIDAVSADSIQSNAVTGAQIYANRVRTSTLAGRR